MNNILIWEKKITKTAQITQKIIPKIKRRVPHHEATHKPINTFQMESQKTGKMMIEITAPEKIAEIFPTSINTDKGHAHFVEKFHGYKKKTAENFIEMGRTIFEAKRGLSEEEFEQFCISIGHTSLSSFISKFLQIGEKADLLLKNIEKLPNAWTTAYQLTQLSHVTLQKVFDDGKVTQKSTGEEIVSIIDEHRYPSKLQSTEKPPKKFKYTYGGKLDSEIDEATKQELDVLIENFLTKRIKSESEPIHSVKNDDN